MRRVLFWGLVATTIGVYLIMVSWTLPTIAADAGGLAPFDMRPGGYSFEEARAFLAALGPAGIAMYEDVQHVLDLFFPAPIATTLYFAIAALLPARLAGWRMILPLAVIPVAVFDWFENSAVAGLLAAGVNGVTPQMVAEASRWSVMKALVSTVAYTVLLVLLIWRGWIWFKLRRWRA